jgi:LysM repeat protein
MAATEWLDYYPFAMTGKLRLDDAVQGSGQTEIGILILECFEIPVPGTKPPLPPILSIWGPVPHPDLFWVCSRLSFEGGEDDVIRDADGNRTMQNVTIELTEYSPSTAIVSGLTPAQAAAQVGANGLPGAPVQSGSTTLVASGKTYTVVAGDTLQSIAANTLGDVNEWTSIALLNGLSYSTILRPGSTLQLPATS